MYRRKVLNRRICKALLVLCVLGSVAYVGPSTQANAEAAAAKGPSSADEVKAFADAFFNRAEIRSKLAGAAFVVVSDNKVLLNKGYGYANLESKQPIDPDKTLFRVASVTKVFTATTVMQLAEQGRIDLEGNVDKYLGGLKIPNNTDSPLKVKHLLTHTTGFDFTDNLKPNSTDLDNTTSLGSFIQERLPTIVRKPGQAYRYDNYASDLQGYLVQSVTGQPFEQVVRERIFQPLHMNNSYLGLTSQLAQRLATGYNSKNQPVKPYLDTPTISPSGGMISTSTDISKFMLAQLNKGKLGEAAILKPETVSEMQKVQVGIHPEQPNMGYGFEMFYHSLYNGQNVVEKSGDERGYHSYMWLLPDRKVGGFIVTNSDSIDVRTELFKEFMDHYYPADQKSHPAFPVSAKDLAKFEGSYRYLRIPMQVFDIKLEDEHLSISTPVGVKKLKPVGDLLFEDEDGRMAAFKADEKGVISHLYYMIPDAWSERVQDQPPYSDVPVNHPYAGFINDLRKLNAFPVNTSSEFAPEKTMTRGEFSAELLGLVGIQPTQSPVQFKDTTGHRYAAQIQTLVEYGAVTGYAKDKFEPDRPITREEAAVLLWRISQQFVNTEVSAKLSGITDSWAQPAVEFVLGSGLYGPEVKPNQDGLVNYHSRSPMLRQEAAALLTKAAGFILAEQANGKV
ncbi:serine hydrolase [Paenibacillus sp. SN-8-1]|uniref:serine hydrolase n=1 Tax=Paenibacillus sp. SN-8-1 TaxID=3435409 RepID=UPI003D9A597E